MKYNSLKTQLRKKIRDLSRGGPNGTFEFVICKAGEKPNANAPLPNGSFRFIFIEDEK